MEMHRTKRFDCVVMKDRIQAKITKEYEGVSSEEARNRRWRKLRVSRNAVARKWRALSPPGNKT